MPVGGDYTTDAPWPPPWPSVPSYPSPPPPGNGYCPDVTTALLDISTNLDQQSVLTDWVSGGDACFDGWSHVTLTGGIVRQLSLQGLGLGGGPLPPSFYTALTTLQIVDLANNAITGTLSTDIGYMTSLLSLNLMNNQLSGSIPAQFAYLTKLTSLDLSVNSFSVSRSGNLTRGTK